MKKWRSTSSRASTLKIALSTGLISISTILFAITPPNVTKKTLPGVDTDGIQGKALHRSAATTDYSGRVITTLGNYPDTPVPLSGDKTVTPDATPTNTTSITVSTN